ncbi:MAG: cytochrome oxidase assembly protein [Gammaproteobacteria bacterium]|nr:cytochrome oxidase assembly protein [Gammaproteobacteria bacterium]
MNQPEPRPGSGRRQLVLVVLVFLGPLLVAAWLYFGSGGWKPAGTSNHGALLEPIVNLGDALPGSALGEIAENAWLLVYARDRPCDDACENALIRLRQSRLMLGNDMSRVQRVFLHGPVAPDRVFIEEQHAGLITTRDRGLAELLERKRPAQLAPGGIYLIDPLTNLVMYFSPELEPREMVEDLKHLLELSRIG